MSNQPIGVFDSGYGGLTILKELVAELPAYDYLYLGDNARAPYGDKTFEEVYTYTLQSVEWFFKQGCSLVILACNTASAKALRTIQQNNLPLIDPNKRVLGVIRPTSEVIGQLTQSNHIGVMGTQGTIKSESYLIEIAKFFPEIKVTQEACPEWVSLVEKNLYDSSEADYFVKYHMVLLMEIHFDQIEQVAIVHLVNNFLHNQMRHIDHSQELVQLESNQSQ
jgi:glutamate racemase